ncbi:MAG: cytochrome P450 [Aggregatilineales bacterium]
MTATRTDPYDIFSLQAQRNPALYDRMRSEDPVHAAIHPHTGQVFWFLTRYDDCLSFLKDKRFGKEFRKQQPAHDATKWIESDTEDIINQHMLNLDDPAHARLKSIVQLVFTPARINNLRPHLQAIADQLFDAIDLDVAEGDEYNLTETYINQFPLLAIATILGVPAEDYPNLYLWTQQMLLSDEEIVHQTITQFSDYLNQQIDLRRTNASNFDDLLSDLIFSEGIKDQLSRPELLAMVFLLITAGYETMVNFTSNSIMSLFDNRDQLRLLQENAGDSAMLKTAIEEMLRFNGPSHRTLPSWAFEDVEIRGKVIHRGDIVHAVLFAANRDPLIFDDPHTFNIQRQPNKHIGFSYGIHHCLGAMLARLEGEIVIATLLRRVPDL